MKHLCPHCHQDCMSTLQKLFTGSASSRQCKGCGKGVHISGKYSACGAILFLGLFLWMHLLEPQPLMILLIGLALVILIALMQIYLFPLVKDKFDEIM